MTTTAAPERCRHDLYPASSCAACNPQLDRIAQTLEPYAIVEAFHKTWCRNECGRWMEQGEQVGFVSGVGVCCADCCGIGGDS